MPGYIHALFFLLVFGIYSPCHAQLVFEPVNSVKLIKEEKELKLPWAGGLNSSQYGKADFDGDGIEEWVLYDRSANNFLIFKTINDKLIPANELGVLLPELSPGWAVFADYNGDGKKDIFSNGDRGIVVYKNTSDPGAMVTWKRIADPLLTTGFSGKINLIANAADVPAITDIDSDGDLDILVYNFAIGGYIRYNKNLSQEIYGHADSLDFEINTRSWGEFAECDCNLFAFNGETCDDPGNGRVMHAGGKALLAFDSDGDGDKDLLVGHEQCVELYFYENMGDTDSAYMTGFSNAFPGGTFPANFHTFPAGYLEDLDFDGIKDLIVTPSFEENYEFKIDFAHSNWFYKNTDSNTIPDFKFIKKNIIQDEMLDFGENAMPVFADINANGRKDLLVAANGYWNGEYYCGYVVELLNIGTTEAPSFSINNLNYLELGLLNLVNPSISLVDMDGNGSKDLVYSGMQTSDFKPYAWVIYNLSTEGQAFDFDFNNKTSLTLPSSATLSDVPIFYDVDTDGKADILLGKGNGALEYYHNQGNEIFELVDAAYLDIDRDFSGMRRNLVATVGDIDGDGEADLTVTDSRGIGRIYFAFQKQINTDVQFVEMAYKNAVTSEDELIQFDSKTWLASADLFGLGSESLVAGGVRGGLQMLKNPIRGQLDGDHENLETSIYPNPIHDLSNLYIKSNQDVSVELISMLGQQMGGPFKVKKFNSTPLNVALLSNGMYILKMRNSAGNTTSEIIMIMK